MIVCQLTVRNRDIADSRARLEQYAGLGTGGTADTEQIGAMTEARCAGDRVSR